MEGRGHPFPAAGRRPPAHRRSQHAGAFKCEQHIPGRGGAARSKLTHRPFPVAVQGAPAKERRVEGMIPLALRHGFHNSRHVRGRVASAAFISPCSEYRRLRQRYIVARADHRDDRIEPKRRYASGVQSQRENQFILFFLRGLTIGRCRGNNRSDCLDRLAERFQSRSLRVFDPFQRFPRATLRSTVEVAGTRTPRVEHRRGSVLAQEEPFNFLLRQPGGEQKAIPLPPPACALVNLLREQPQDAERLQVVRQRRRCAAAEFMDVDHRGLPCEKRRRQIADRGRGSRRSYARKAAK